MITQGDFKSRNMFDGLIGQMVFGTDVTVYKISWPLHFIGNLIATNINISTLNNEIVLFGK